MILLTNFLNLSRGRGQGIRNNAGKGDSVVVIVGQSDTSGIDQEPEKRGVVS